jgi:hypothetical protein
VLAGIVQDAEYFRRAVEPHLDGEMIRFVGSVGATERNALLGGAAALLHLIQFDEPFGLSVIEAMATGTPVIAIRRGSMPELIVEGETGFLVDGVAAATAAVGRVASLNRAAVRAHVQRSFTAEQMVSNYLELYQRLAGIPAERRPRPAGARCDACHERRPRAHRTRDNLLTVCTTCARGVDVASSSAGEAIAAVVSRAPAAERRALTRRLSARQLLHTQRRARTPAESD